jgi:hypothetical protein
MFAALHRNYGLALALGGAALGLFLGCQKGDEPKGIKFRELEVWSIQEAKDAKGRGALIHVGYLGGDSAFEEIRLKPGEQHKTLKFEELKVRPETIGPPEGPKARIVITQIVFLYTDSGDREIFEDDGTLSNWKKN